MTATKWLNVSDINEKIQLMEHQLRSSTEQPFLDTPSPPRNAIRIRSFTLACIFEPNAKTFSFTAAIPNVAKCCFPNIPPTTLELDVDLFSRDYYTLLGPYACVRDVDNHHSLCEFYADKYLTDFNRMCSQNKLLHYSDFESFGFNLKIPVNFVKNEQKKEGIFRVSLCSNFLRPQDDEAEERCRTLLARDGKLHEPWPCEFVESTMRPKTQTTTPTAENNSPNDLLDFSSTTHPNVWMLQKVPWQVLHGLVSRSPFVPNGYFYHGTILIEVALKICMGVASCDMYKDFVLISHRVGQEEVKFVMGVNGAKNRIIHRPMTVDDLKRGYTEVFNYLTHRYENETKLLEDLSSQLLQPSSPQEIPYLFRVIFEARLTPEMKNAAFCNSLCLYELVEKYLTKIKMRTNWIRKPLLTAHPGIMESDYFRDNFPSNLVLDRLVVQTMMRQKHTRGFDDEMLKYYFHRTQKENENIKIIYPQPTRLIYHLVNSALMYTSHITMCPSRHLLFLLNEEKIAKYYETSLVRGIYGRTVLCGENCLIGPIGLNSLCDNQDMVTFLICTWMQEEEEEEDATVLNKTRVFWHEMKKVPVFLRHSTKYTTFNDAEMKLVLGAVSDREHLFFSHWLSPLDRIWLLTSTLLMVHHTVLCLCHRDHSLYGGFCEKYLDGKDEKLLQKCLQQCYVMPRKFYNGDINSKIKNIRRAMIIVINADPNDTTQHHRLYLGMIAGNIEPETVIKTHNYPALRL